MSKYSKKTKNLYGTNGGAPFPISRSAIDLFLECRRCFYLDKKLGLARPSMPGWALNSAVDQLLKNEFDILRKNGETHALMKKYGIEAVPFNHPDFPIWQNSFRGASVIHKKTNLRIYGAIDDIWINEKKQEIYVVDYKSTSTVQEISLDDEYKKGYKKQMEVYQWIFRQMGFKVSKIGYFVFANAMKNLPKFDGKLEFEVSIVSHKGDDSWVEPTIFEIKKCLESNKIPLPNEDCKYCAYIEAVEKELK